MSVPCRLCNGLCDIKNNGADSAAFGIEDCAHGAAAAAVKAGKQQRRVVNHVYVTAHHAAWGIAAGNVCCEVALCQKPRIGFFLLAVPFGVLAVAGDGGFQNDFRMLFFQLKHLFGKVGISADGHSADKVPVSAFIDSFQGCGELLF